MNIGSAKLMKMENKEVKEDSHVSQHAKQVTKEFCNHADNVANKAEQSENFERTFSNIEVSDTNCSNNLINSIMINEMNELSNGIKYIELNLTRTDECLTQFHFAANLTLVNLSNNELKEVPAALVTLNHLVKLNLSHNKIRRFDETPSFLHTLQELSLAYNSLVAPPLWIWKEKPQVLNHLDISNNECIVKFLTDQEKYDFLNCTLTVIKIMLNNCCIHLFREILLTLVDVKELYIGVDGYTVSNVNEIEEFPCKDLECYNVEKLHLCHVKLYNITETIKYYTSLAYLDLSFNGISDLPTEFGDLKLLEICKLSFNKILYLPDTLLNLKKLKALYIDNNGLYMLPENLLSLPELKCVDVYSNYLENNPFEIYDQLDEVDFAQNCFNEPEDSVYIANKTKLRNEPRSEGRIDGKRDTNYVESEHSPSEYESDYSLLDNLNDPEKTHSPGPVHVESEEDWDSDSYWEPSFVNRYYVEKKSHWETFLKKKMMEGNFCPVDLHEPTIIDKIKYSRSICPRPQYVPVEGQYDDLSDDDDDDS